MNTIETVRALTDDPSSSVYVECRECADCGHAGINDSHHGDACCGACGWSGPSPKEDRCPECSAENVMGAACPQCSGRYAPVATALLAAHAAASTDGTALAVEPLPMASAPKDGRPILAWSTYNVYAFIVRFDRELEDFEDNNGFSVRNLIGWWPLPIRKEID